MKPEDKSEAARNRGGSVGRMAGKFVKNAGPRTKLLIDESRPKIDKALEDTRPKVQKAVEDFRPKVEQAGRDAVRYAQDHQDELTGLAMRGVRMRLGPLGMALDALGVGAPQARPAQTACPACTSQNTGGAKFCAQCGTPLSGGRSTTA